ncbi:MAG: F0F1 ATP synthase subunit B [Candidatus Kaiserbacteria bacterium]|nr:MAG: F0F1 ATP synthase subunit B [Candidatus Kaiserbacteria bacterium]
MSELFAAFGINWKLLLTQALNFGVLLAALWYFLYRPVLKMIDDRRAKIAEGVQKAEAAERQLADAKAEGDSLIGSASREAEGLVAAARTRAEGRADEIVKGAEGQAASILKDAAARAEEAKRAALQESQKEIARAAMLAAEKILREKA